MWHATPAAAAQSFFGLTVQEVWVGWGGGGLEKKKSLILMCMSVARCSNYIFMISK